MSPVTEADSVFAASRDPLVHSSAPVRYSIWKLSSDDDSSRQKSSTAVALERRPPRLDGAVGTLSTSSLTASDHERPYRLLAPTRNSYSVESVRPDTVMEVVSAARLCCEGMVFVVDTLTTKPVSLADRSTHVRVAAPLAGPFRATRFAGFFGGWKSLIVTASPITLRRSRSFSAASATPRVQPFGDTRVVEK